MIKIKGGSIFDEKCDLLILPCDSNGGVTSWVENEIRSNSLPFPSAPLSYGKVRFMESGNYVKSNFIGYAASIDGETITSSNSAIRSIADEILRYCEDTNCSIVNLPLLGSGAGKLSPTDVLNVYAEVLGKSSATFNVYIPDKRIKDSLRDFTEEEQTFSTQEDEHPRVFISYSWKDESVKNWAYDLAHRLCQNGVDARLDRFHLRPGMDLPQWMTNELLKASKVLLICDSHYAEKADMRKAGVGWETMIIQGDMLLQGELNSKYIVITYGDFEKNTPIYMKSKLSMPKEDIDKDITKLLEHIYDIDTAPQIGKIPSWVRQKRKSVSQP
jgi:hypothetical protein